MNTKSVMIVGVGGQGSLLASKLLGRLLLDEGFDVKVSEVHGMSQRGGSVVTYVRFGERVYSPIITEGQADIIIAFEKLEAARYAKFLKADGKIIVNTQEIDPMPVIIGAAEYPRDVLNELTNKGLSVEAMDALSLAEQAGSAKAVNIVLMGRAAKQFDIPYERWIKAIENTVAPKFIEMNKKAFDLGYNY
ncbi:MAG: indolepyruvate oxidoreductase subunit beta [Acutalibacteraceae bacterium]|nr:indolepyruvate oxidoreductase subunit beta [Clostridia bacterium]MEE0809212.1 indolepyruvate oxidoreductase subunit beta [Acutalibacteraceae bacterium]